MSKFQNTKLHPVFEGAIVEGVKRHAQTLKGIKVLSGVIADMMEELHGGDWKVQIDHEAGLVAISQEFDAGALA